MILLPICCCCAAIPASIVVLLVALAVPNMMTIQHCAATDITGACKLARAGPPTSCDAGAFVGLVKQSKLGLLHTSVQKEGLPFASLLLPQEYALEGGVHDEGSWKASVAYSIACGDGIVEVVESSLRGIKRFPLGESWEVCAKNGYLSLLQPVIDLTYDLGVPNKSNVTGCVRITAPATFSHLDSVRGSFSEQQVALKKAKAAFGGCPTWKTENDVMDRGADYISEFGQLTSMFVGQLMKRAVAKTKQYNAGVPLETDTWGVLMFVGSIVSGGGEHAGTVIAPTMFCGMPGPASIPAIGNSFQITRHGETAQLIADPHQKRVRQIGGGSSEVCFEPTLPVFLSTGDPPHSQTRKLWDAVGLATMHLSELPDVVVPPESIITKVKHAGMKLIGINHPMLDELALYVAPLFLEKLWGKTPNVDEIAAIGAYGVFGGPCIMSQIVEKLPIVPSKIRSIRAAALSFARDSPVGKKIAVEIQKEEYAELRAVYASRPMGVVDGALGALADASLFAGLIGTSTMTMNALMQVHRGPQYLRMFRQNSTAFLLEVMRTATAVAGSLQALKTPLKLNMLGEAVELKSGTTIIQMTGMAAGLDESVFPDPYTFDSSRPNLGETQNFNGLSKFVLARDYTGAPRFCPGAAVSINIASKLVNHFTKDMKSE